MTFYLHRLEPFGAASLGHWVALQHSRPFLGVAAPSPLAPSHPNTQTFPAKTVLLCFLVCCQNTYTGILESVSSLQVSITSQELPNTAETSPRASEDRDLPGKAVESKGGTSRLLWKIHISCCMQNRTAGRKGRQHRAREKVRKQFRL